MRERRLRKRGCEHQLVYIYTAAAPRLYISLRAIYGGIVRAMRKLFIAGRISRIFTLWKLNGCVFFIIENSIYIGTARIRIRAEDDVIYECCLLCACRCADHLVEIKKDTKKHTSFIEQAKLYIGICVRSYYAMITIYEQRVMFVGSSDF